MHLEPDTFLLPRPEWVNDEDVFQCGSCNSSFGPLRRRHHCRNCGNIFCHNCSTRSVPLPQLGYGTKPARVCNGCFDVAYLVTYTIDEDHGLSTQIHGARGLLELIENDNENDLHNIIAYGGIDALIWLCKSSNSKDLHHVTTTILAILAEKESIRPVIITKCALPPLLELIKYYTSEKQSNSSKPSPKNISNSIHSGITSTSATSSSLSATTHPSAESLESESEGDHQHTISLDISINCIHVLYQVARAGILSLKEIIGDGILDTLLSLSAFEINNISYEKLSQDRENENRIERQQMEAEAQNQIAERTLLIQNLSAKSISFLCSFTANQPHIIEQLRETDIFGHLLLSSNDDVQKYIAKSIAYLSLRNDKYKPYLLINGGADSLVSILVLLPLEEDHEQPSSKRTESDDGSNITETRKMPCVAAVSHVCCALANFATNNESQIQLMKQPKILQYICNVPTVFPTHVEIHRHIARCLANFALYEENSVKMLPNTRKNDKEEGAYNVIPTLLALSQTPHVTSDIQRHCVRAIDNLSANENHGTCNMDKFFEDVDSFISSMLESSDDKDTLKRAEGIQQRVKLMKEQQPSLSNVSGETEPPSVSDEQSSPTVVASSKKKKKKGVESA
ncbi:hypothetical protein BDF14DRAFT_1769854 [Spinellus fusiger]|nr:hypothetical protein BDF14DRAFT_1769854 [Spinellus fusiger]